MADNAGQETGQARGSGEHAIGWLELTTNNAEGFQKFYSEVFGWGFRPFQDDYFFYDTPKGMMGGVRVNPPEGSPKQTFYVNVKDVDEAFAQVSAAGGQKVHDKVKIGDWGHIGFFTDPAGVIVGLSDMLMPIDYQPAPMLNQKGLVPGSLVAIEAYGGDLAKTGEFYRSVFGWNCTETMPQYLAFDTGNGVGGVFQGHTPAAPVLAYVWVEDVSAALAKVEAAGGTRQGEPMAMPGTPVFGYFVDPYGNGFGLMGPK